MTIKEILNNRNILIEENNSIILNPPDSIIKLSILIAENYSICQSFIKYMRNCYSNKISKCSFCLSPLSQAETNATLVLVQELCKTGIISDLYIQDKTRIHGNFSMIPRITNFLNGDFLELYARYIAETVISNAASENNEDYENFSFFEENINENNIVKEPLITETNLLPKEEIKNDINNQNNNIENSSKLKNKCPKILIKSNKNSNTQLKTNFYNSFIGSPSRLIEGRLSLNSQSKLTTLNKKNSDNIQKKRKSLTKIKKSENK